MSPQLVCYMVLVYRRAAWVRKFRPQQPNHLDRRYFATTPENPLNSKALIFPQSKCVFYNRNAYIKREKLFFHNIFNYELIKYLLL